MPSKRTPKASSHESRKESNNDWHNNYRREASVHLTPAREMDFRERRHNAIHVPEAVLRPGLLPLEQQSRLNMHQMNGGERVYWKHGNKAHFSSVWLDEISTRPCHEEMRRFQELVLKSQTSKKLGNGKTGGLTFLSISVKKIGRHIQPSFTFQHPESHKDDPDMQEMIRLAASIITKLFKIGVPSDLVEMLYRQSAINVSLGAGHHDNVFTSQMQTNVSMLNEDLATSIGQGGALHMDANNDPAKLSIVLFLSNLPPEHCPGKFILPSERMFCSTAPYTAIICSGHLPHWPIPPAKYEANSIRYVSAGPIPPPPNQEYRRISMVSYPHRTAMNRAPDRLKEIMLKPESLFIYGTKRNQHEFWARLQARKTAQEALKSNIELNEWDVSKIILDNMWYENDIAKFPRSKIIAECLFGEPVDAEWQERVDFISKKISCGHNFEGGRRSSLAIITDVDDATRKSRSTIEGRKVRNVKRRRGALESAITDSGIDQDHTTLTDQAGKQKTKTSCVEVRTNVDRSDSRETGSPLSIFSSTPTMEEH